MAKKYPSRDNIPALPTEISKWQKASVELVELKFKVHNILKQFSEEERQSEQYRELTDILKGIIIHVIDDHPAPIPPIQVIVNTEEKEEKKGFKESIKRFWNLKTLFIATATALFTAIAPYVPEIIRTVVQLFTGVH